MFFVVVIVVVLVFAKVVFFDATTGGFAVLLKKNKLGFLLNFESGLSALAPMAAASFFWRPTDVF